MKGMKTAKIVRESRGLNPCEMHKKMQKKTVQAYLSLERKAQRMTEFDFAKLCEIYGKGDRAFMDLVRKCAQLIEED